MNNYWDRAGNICIALICMFILCWTYSLSVLYLIIFAIWFIGEIRKHQTQDSLKVVTDNITAVEQLDHDPDVVMRKDIFDL